MNPSGIIQITYKEFGKAFMRLMKECKFMDEFNASIALILDQQFANFDMLRWNDLPCLSWFSVDSVGLTQRELFNYYARRGRMFLADYDGWRFSLRLEKNLVNFFTKVVFEKSVNCAETFQRWRFWLWIQE